MGANSRIIETKLGLANEIIIQKNGAITTTYFGFFYMREKATSRIVKVVQDETNPLETTIKYYTPNGSAQHDFDWDQRETYDYQPSWGL